MAKFGLKKKNYQSDDQNKNGNANQGGMPKMVLHRPQKPSCHEKINQARDHQITDDGGYENTADIQFFHAATP
jgi:hypothetical protein